MSKLLVRLNCATPVVAQFNQVDYRRGQFVLIKVVRVSINSKKMNQIFLSYYKEAKKVSLPLVEIRFCFARLTITAR